MAAVDSVSKMFIQFCEEDGFDWEEAGLHAVLAFIALVFETTAVFRTLLRNYISSINGAYALHGHKAPARPYGSDRLYKDASMALVGFTKDPLLQGGSEPGGAEAMNSRYYYREIL